jgi:hypothetical protein
METIGNIAKAISEALGFARTRDERANTEAMKANESARRDEAVKAKATAAVQSNDLETIRKMGGE